MSAALGLGSLPAFGQGSPSPGAAGSPSTQQIIKSLAPTSVTPTTRGIRMVRPGELPAPQAAAAAPSVNLVVLFATNSAELTPEATQTLDQLGSALNSQRLEKYRFRVEGHTDTVGSAAYNRALSQRRAEAAVAYLEQKFGIPKARLEPVGEGESGLLVPTGDQTAEPRNRRVLVVNLGA